MICNITTSLVFKPLNVWSMKCQKIVKNSSSTYPKTEDDEFKWPFNNFWLREAENPQKLKKKNKKQKMDPPNVWSFGLKNDWNNIKELAAQYFVEDISLIIVSVLVVCIMYLFLGFFTDFYNMSLT